jgi:hypothetical protein
MTVADNRITRRSILVGAAASLICAPAIVQAVNLMMVRGLPLQLIIPKRRVLKTMGTGTSSAFTTTSRML